MSFWKENVDRILTSNDRKVLIGAGTISNAQMEEKAMAIYEQFDANRKTFLATEADKQDLEGIEKQVKTRKKK